MKNVLLDFEKTTHVFNTLLNSGLHLEKNLKKRKLTFKNSEEENVASLRLSLNIDLDENGQKLRELEFVNYVLILIRSGQASLGLFENGELSDHKVFRAYMVRKKQGKSQIKYLKTKGKSRAGSRVRLAETLEFFDEINLRLNKYFSEYRIDSIGLSCATTLIPYFYGGKEVTPFEKNDKRIFKIPMHTSTPTFEALLKIREFMSKTEFELISKEYVSSFKPLFTNDLNNFIEKEDEDW